jgi:hypothetical protein
MIAITPIHHAVTRSPVHAFTLYPNVGILNPVGTAFASGHRVDTTLPRV